MESNHDMTPIAGEEFMLIGVSSDPSILTMPESRPANNHTSLALPCRLLLFFCVGVGKVAAFSHSHTKEK